MLKGERTDVFPLIEKNLC